RARGTSKRRPTLSGSMLTTGSSFPGPDDDLAEDLPALERGLARRRLRERQHAVDHGSQLAREGERGDALELAVRPAIAAHQALLAPEEIADVRRPDGARRRAARHEAAALAERADAPLPRRRAHRLDDHVGAALAGESAHGGVPALIRRVVDQVIGAVLADARELVVRRRRGDDARAHQLRDLHRGQADT